MFGIDPDLLKKDSVGWSPWRPFMTESVMVSPDLGGGLHFRADVEVGVISVAHLEEFDMEN